MNDDMIPYFPHPKKPVDEVMMAELAAGGVPVTADEDRKRIRAFLMNRGHYTISNVFGYANGWIFFRRKFDWVMMGPRRGPGSLSEINEEMLFLDKNIRSFFPGDDYRNWSCYCTERTQGLRNFMAIVNRLPTAGTAVPDVPKVEAVAPPHQRRRRLRRDKLTPFKVKKAKPVMSEKGQSHSG